MFICLLKNFDGQRSRINEYWVVVYVLVGFLAESIFECFVLEEKIWREIKCCVHLYSPELNERASGGTHLSK